MNDRRLTVSIFIVFALLLPGGGLLRSESGIVPTSDHSVISPAPEEATGLEQFLQGAHSFTENRGQFHDKGVLFYTSGGGIGSGFRENGLSVSVLGPKEGYCYQVEFAGGSAPGPTGMVELEQKSNFFIGSEPENWFVDVPNFESITYPEVWSGIDIVYRTDQGMLKYDIVVRPWADVNDIRFGFDGVEPVISDDDLVMETPVGTVVDDAPISFQNGRKVETWWEIDEEGKAAFGIGPYDRSTELVIDPGLRFSSYAGGSSLDRGRSLVVDSQGYIFITGYTASNDFPTTTGAFDTGFNGGTNGDAFVFKVNISGDTLIYSTYLGGNQNDYGQGIDVDSQGNAYVAGQTFSNNYPTQSAFDTQYANSGDAFVTKVSSSGNSLSYSTYLGGWAEDGANDIKVVDRYAYVTGLTAYVNTGWPDQWKYPVTSGAYDTVHNGGEDVFVTKLSQNGGSLSYSTLIGSSQNEEGFSIAVDSSGSAFVTGGTASSSFPTTSGAYDTSYGGNEDGFSLRLSSSGNSLTYSSFLGGSSYDRGLGIAIDSQNRAYVTGETGSNNYPTTTNAYDTSYGGSNDAFLTVFSSSGNSLINSTYIGGSGQDIGRSVFLSSTGEAHVTGETYSGNFPTTSGAVSSSNSGGSDVFMTKIDIGGTGLVYSTYIGGSNNDEGMDVFVDPLGFIYLTGETNSNDFPTTYVAFDRTHNSNDDVFFTKFYPADFSPTGLTARSGYFYVNITWNPPTTPIVTTNPVIGYNIYRGTSQTRLNQIASIGKIEHYNDTINDFTSRTYYYFVSAILQNLGESGESNMVSATPLVTPFPFDPVAVPGDLHVNLTWTTIDQVYLDLFDIDYHVYRGLTSSSLIRVASVGEAGFYNDTDVPPRPSTFYYMVSYNVRGVGESNLTNIVQGIPNTPPGEPEDTTLEGLDMAMNVSWLPPARDGGYPLEGYSLYKGLAPGSISHLTELDASTTTYIDRDIVPGTTYFYAVSSSNRLGGSGLTEPIEGMGQTLPSPPKDLNALPLDQRISLEWKAPEFDWGVSVLGYKIYRGTDPDQLVHHKDIGGGVRSFTDTVTNGVTYMYSITAYNIHGESGQAGPLEAMATGIPGVVTNVTFGIGDSWVRLDWSPPVSDGGLPITVYKVYRGLQIDRLDTEFVLSSGARSFKDTEVENGVTYYYKVSASNRKGESALSAAVIATPGRVASRITQLTVAGGLESATISWTEPTDLGGREGLNIKIYRGASISSLAPLDQVPFTTRTYTDQGLSAGKVYYYALTVINPLGEGARSPAVSAMVFGRPSAPLISGVDASSHMLNITWEPPEEDGGVPLTGYRVEIRQEGDLEWEGFIETDLYHEFFGLTSGVTYDLRVMAVNTLSDGEPTEIVKVLVGDPPEEPRDVRVEPLKPEIRVKWSPRPQIALPVLGYNVYMAIGEGEPFLFRTVDSDVFEIIIEDVIQGEEYSFAVSSFNIIGEGRATAFKSVISTSSPTPVPLIWISDIGDTRVEISWVPPVFNGGAEVTGYTLFKGTTPEAPNQLATAVQGLRFIDEDVINGRIYYYRVRAENGESSEKSYPVEARPAGKPGAPQIFEGDAKTDHVVLTWIPPSKDGGDVVTGYLLYRGGSLDDLTVIAHLTGNDSEYIDREVSGGRYLYRLQAENDNGIGVPVDIYVDVPSRTLYAVMAGAIGLILPLIIILLVLFMPGYLQKRREIKERKKKEAEEEELRIRRMRAEEMAARGLPGKVAGGIGLGGRAHHPSMAPPPPIHDLPPVQEPAGEDKGYIRPKEMKKERRDKKKVLRADGKSLEHREKEEDLRHSLRSRDDHKGKHWEADRKKALEEESRKVFTGQQFEEPAAAPPPMDEEMVEEPEDDGIVPTVEDVMKEMPSMSGGALEFDEDIPTWGEEEEEPVEDIPMAKIPEVRPGSAEDIEEYEELDELEELEELDELDDFEE